LVNFNRDHDVATLCRLDGRSAPSLNIPHRTYVFKYKLLGFSGAHTRVHVRQPPTSSQTRPSDDVTPAAAQHSSRTTQVDDDDTRQMSTQWSLYSGGQHVSQRSSNACDKDKASSSSSHCRAGGFKAGRRLNGSAVYKRQLRAAHYASLRRGRFIVRQARYLRLIAGVSRQASPLKHGRPRHTPAADLWISLTLDNVRATVARLLHATHTLQTYVRPARPLVSDDFCFYYPTHTVVSGHT